MCKECTNENTKQCEFQKDGTEQVLLCEDGFVLDSQNKTCNKYCKNDEHMEVVYDPVHNIEKKIFCKKCHESCQSCAGEGADQCITCNEGKFLNVIG